MSKTIQPIIAIVGNANIAEFLSGKFAGNKGYFAIMEEPWIKRPDSENEIIGRNNLLACIKHDYLILAGCEEKTCELFLNRFPESYHKKIIIIKDEQDIDKNRNILEKYLSDSEPNKQYISTSQLGNLSKDENIAIIENSDSIGVVIAENFCIAEGYKILRIEKATLELVDNIVDLLRKWNLHKDSMICEDAKNDLFKILRNRIGNLDSFEFKQLVFFTKGIPYGILPFHSPVTHFLLERDLGLQILAGYKRINENNGFAIAMICDPGEIPDTESIEIKKILKEKGVEVLDLNGAKANVYRFMHLIERYPFDFAMINSHASEVDGRRITSEITTSKGTTHRIVYDLYASFAPVPEERNVIVTEKVVPISVDGILWSDKKRKKENVNTQHFNLLEFIKEIRHNNEREKVLKTEDCQGVKFSNALKLYHFTWIPTMHVVGETRYPIIFNNACSSWIEMASMFIFVGASVYIGTTKDIISTMAKECGRDFIKWCLLQESMSSALFEAQKQFIIQLNYSPYLYWGHPDIILQPSVIDNKEIRKQRVRNTLNGLIKKRLVCESDYMKKKIHDIIKCLQEVE